MASFGKILLVSLSACVLTMKINAETIDSSKQSAMQQWLPNSYSYLMLRNYQETDSKNPSSIVPKWQARYTLGSTFFNSRLDTRVVFGVNKEAQTTVLKDRGTRVQMELDAYSNDYYQMTPYMEVDFPRTKSEGKRVLIGVNNGFNYSWDTKVGEVEFSFVQDIVGYFGTETKRVRLSENGALVNSSSIKEELQRKFNLIKDDSGESLMIEEKSPTLLQELSFGAKWEPQFVKGLTFKLWRYYYEQMTPKVEFNRSRQTVEMPRSGILNLPNYRTSYERWNRFAVNYDVNDDVWVALDTYLGDKVKDKYQYKFLTSMGINLF